MNAPDFQADTIYRVPTNAAFSIWSIHYFLQTGFLFPQNPEAPGFPDGQVVWTDTSHGLAAIVHDGIRFSPLHTYFFSITFTNGIWWMCANDNHISAYHCEPEPAGTGTHLASNPNTSIWAENVNTNSYWWVGLDGPWKAKSAKIYRNGVAQNWSSEHKHTAVGSNCPTQNWPTSNALGGTLVGGGTATFKLPGVPLRCP